MIYKIEAKTIVLKTAIFTVISFPCFFLYLLLLNVLTSRDNLPMNDVIIEDLKKLIVIYIVAIPLALFLGIMLSKSTLKKAEHLRAEVAKVRTIICEGPTNHMINRKKGFGGWMFLSEDALEFYPYKLSRGEENIAILLDNIKIVYTQRNKLFIKTDKTTYTFGVCKATLWKNDIEKTI